MSKKRALVLATSCLALLIGVVNAQLTPFLTENFENWNTNEWYVIDATGGLTIPYATGVYDNNCARVNGSAIYETYSFSKGNYSLTYLNVPNITVIFHINVVSYRETGDNYKNIFQYYDAYGSDDGGLRLRQDSGQVKLEFYGSDTNNNTDIALNTWYRVQIDVIIDPIGSNGIEKCTVTNVLTSDAISLYDWSGDNSWLESEISAFWFGKLHPETLSSLDLFFDYCVIAPYGYTFSIPTSSAWYENISFDLILLFTALGMTFGGAVWFVLKVREHNDIYQIVNGLIICIVGIAITYGWFMNYA